MNEKIDKNERYSVFVTFNSPSYLEPASKILLLSIFKLIIYLYKIFVFLDDNLIIFFHLLIF